MLTLLARLARRRHLRLFPITDSLRGYSADAWRGDLRAGVNVALLAFPQGMAYAAIAGLPIEYGIYGTIIACLIAPLFSGTRFIAAGPTNATAVLVFASLLSLNYIDPQERMAVIPLVVLLSGVMLVLGAFLRVASLVQYVSRSVITGYITAAAFYIIINQLKKVFGFDFVLPPGGTVLDVIRMTVEYLPQTHWPTALLSLGTAAFYLLATRFLAGWPVVGLTLLAFSAGPALFDHFFHLNGWSEIRTLTAVRAGDWTVTAPPLSVDAISKVANAAMVLAFLSMLEGCSIGKTLAARTGERINLNQEVLGLGMGNIACAFYQGMPVSGSLTRSQLNFTSGARTAWSTVISGLFCAVAVFLFGPFIGYIPDAVLGVLVIAIGVSLINRRIIRVVWRATRSDRAVFITTFAAALIASLDFAIILGVGVSILLFLRKAAQPELIEYTQTEEGILKPMEAGQTDQVPEVSIVHVEGELFFGAAELFRDQMRRACAKPNLKVVILKMRNAYHLDATSVLALEDLVRFMQTSGRALLISEVRPDAARIIRDSGLIATLGEGNLFPDDPNNPTLSTSKAIRRSMSYLDGQEAEVKIFLGGSKRSREDETTDA